MRACEYLGMAVLNGELARRFLPTATVLFMLADRQIGVISPNPREHSLHIAIHDGNTLRKQNEATAAAVERPMPGNVIKSAAEDGNFPPKRDTTSCAHWCKLRARL